MQKNARALALEEGSRLVANRNGGVAGKNDCTCLRDAIIAIVPSKTNKESFSLALTSAMLDEGDTPIMRVRQGGGGR